MAKTCPVYVYPWWDSHPPIGMFIALLALVGVLVPWFRGQATRREKAFWTVVMFSFLAGELRTLYLDRGEHDREQAQVECEQLRRFGQIADKMDNAISASESQFAETMRGVDQVYGKTEQAADTATEAVNTITGGNRILALTIIPSLTQQDSGTAFVFAPDHGIVRNVRVRVVNLTLFDKDVITKHVTSYGGANDLLFSVGDLGEGEGEDLQPIIKLVPGNFLRFNIFFSGLNGMWTENLLLRKKNGYWFEALRVFRRSTKLAFQSDRDVVYKQIGKGYLEKNEKMDWNAVPQ